MSEKLWLDNGKNFSRNHKQGYRVYDSDNIACTLNANGGGIGGCTGLYLVRNYPKEYNN